VKANRITLSFCIILTILQLTGCVDDPNPVGASSFPKSDFSSVRVDTFYATGYSSLQNLLYTSNIDRFMIGKFRTYEAWTCLKFYQWPDTLLGASITGATIKLRPVYSFGDPSSSFSFDVDSAKAYLFGDSLSFDSLKNNAIYYYSNSPANAPFTIQPSDTICTIDIDTTMVRKWFITNNDTMHFNDGIVLIPANSYLNVIKGFYSYYASDASYQPALYINYIDTNGITRTYTHKISISRYVSTFEPSDLDEDVFVQNGISYRGLISFDSILTTWPVSIHRAVLQITLDSSKSSSQFVPFGTPFVNNLLYALSVDVNGKSDGMTVWAVKFIHSI
jgi:hypothetical protein